MAHDERHAFARDFEKVKNMPTESIANRGLEKLESKYSDTPGFDEESFRDTYGSVGGCWYASLPNIFRRQYIEIEKNYTGCAITE